MNELIIKYAYVFLSLFFFQVDCTTEKTVCDKFGVKGFPTLKIFRNGVPAQDYDGPRDADGIVKFMRGQSGPSSKELKTVAEFEKFTGGDENVVIGWLIYFLAFLNLII